MAAATGRIQSTMWAEHLNRSNGRAAERIRLAGFRGLDGRAGVVAPLFSYRHAPPPAGSGRAASSPASRRGGAFYPHRDRSRRRIARTIFSRLRHAFRARLDPSNATGVRLCEPWRRAVDLRWTSTRAAVSDVRACIRIAASERPRSGQPEEANTSSMSVEVAQGMSLPSAA